MKKELLRDLKLLLEKYNVSIGFDFGEGSDTHGMYDERIVISSDETDKNVFEVNGYFLSASDLEGA